MAEIELDEKLSEISAMVKRARAVFSCLSDDLFDRNEPSGEYECFYDHYQTLAFVINDYLFEAEKDIRELREGE